EVIFLTRYVRGFKYRQIYNLFDLYSKFGIPYFEPTSLKLLDEKYTIITPPVLEKIGEKYYILEGNTRITYAFRNSIQSIRCVIVEGVNDPLPSKGEYTAKEILLSDKNIIGEDRYDEFDYSRFRKIEKAIRNPK